MKDEQRLESLEADLKRLVEAHSMGYITVRIYDGIGREIHLGVAPDFAILGFIPHMITQLHLAIMQVKYKIATGEDPIVWPIMKKTNKLLHEDGEEESL